MGKGAYGLVVAAVNRLDGRQYAIKKIKMPSSAPAAYSRLMREVATLARLQHPYVVRYFQVSHLPNDLPNDSYHTSLNDCCNSMHAAVKTGMPSQLLVPEYIPLLSKPPCTLSV